MSTTGMIYNIQRLSTEDGPGIRTTVFFKGCPLHCPWCSNPESQSFQPQMLFFEDNCTGCGQCAEVCPNGAAFRRENGSYGLDRTRCTSCGVCIPTCPGKARVMSGRPYDADEVMAVVKKDATFYLNSGGGVTFGGGECTAQPAFLMELVDACFSMGLHICLDTCGFCDPEIFARFIPRTDLFLYDLKHMDPARHRELTGRDNGPVLANLKAILADDPEKVRIRVPLMKGINDTEENMAAMADFLLPMGISEVDVMPCHTFGRNKYLALQRPVPGWNKYTPTQVEAAVQRFGRHGLTANLA